MTATSRRPPATLASWSANLVRALDSRGVDGRELARRAGMDPDRFGDPDARVARAALTRLWELAVEATGDPCFGLVAARHVNQTTFHALGYAVLASGTLEEALGRIIRYRRLLGDIMELSLIEEDDRYRFVIDVSSHPGGVPFEAIDAFSAVCVRQARLLRGGAGGTPLELRLRRPEPADSSPFMREFRAPVLFSQPANEIVYSREDVKAALPTGNAELARQNDEVVVRYLARLDKDDLAQRVQQVIMDVMPQGPPTKQVVARRMGMSARSLQRGLEEAGTSFKQVLEEMRLGLARSYIDEGRYSVTEIAFLLGFADTSTFSRAFKRWTGTSPRGARTSRA